MTSPPHTTHHCDINKTHTIRHSNTDSHTLWATLMLTPSHPTLETTPSLPISSKSSTSISCYSNASVVTTTSDRQLWPRVAINYNETVLIKLHGRPQVRMLNNVLIPLPDMDEEDTKCSMVSTDCSDNKLDLQNFKLQNQFVIQYQIIHLKCKQLSI